MNSHFKLAVLAFAAALSWRATGATVTTTNDSGPGSLREIIANASAGETIDFAVTGTIVLTSGELLIQKPMTISGPGSTNLIVERSSAAGTPEFRLVHVQNGPVTISGLTLRNGRLIDASLPTGLNGAGILNEGTLTLEGCVISENTTRGYLSFGIGIYGAAGSLTVVSHCTIERNVAEQEFATQGGGIYAVGDVVINDSTLRNNFAVDMGGGLVVGRSSQATINRSTFDSNKANTGGSIANFGSLMVTNSTFFNNAFSGMGGTAYGGTIFNASQAEAAVVNCTIIGNAAVGAGGIFNYAISGDPGILHLQNSIVVGNAVGDVTSSIPITSAGHNLIGWSSGVVSGPGDQFNMLPAQVRLGPLADNGGPTWTMALYTGSPALDHADPNDFPAIDQRGITRPQFAAPDIGAYEGDSSTNYPHTLHISLPVEGEVLAGTNVFMQVDAGPFATLSVEYFANGESIAVVTNSFTPGASPDHRFNSIDSIGTFPGFLPIGTFPFTWQDATPGNYALTAKSIDNLGNIAVSDPVHITVVPMPVITVHPTDPNALETPGWAGNPGVFTVTRTGDTNYAQWVYYVVGGTATKGQDYHDFSIWAFDDFSSTNPVAVSALLIPAGQESRELNVIPLKDKSREPIETVTLTLHPALPRQYVNPPSGRISQYEIGTPDSATVQITDSRHSSPPDVRITSPRFGQLIPKRTDLVITVETTDRNSHVTQVEFFDGKKKLGQVVQNFLVPPPPGSLVTFQFRWANVPAGMHKLRARATDTDGKINFSPSILIQVGPTP